MAARMCFVLIITSLTSSGNWPHQVSNSAAPLRRSARLQRVEPPVAILPRQRERGNSQKSIRSHTKEATHLQLPQLPSPSQTYNAWARPSKKRKLLPEDLGDDPASKAPRICEPSQGETTTAREEIYDPITSWVQTGHWPKGFAEALGKMSELPAQEPSKRRTSSAHRSELKRQRAEQGVFLKETRRLSKRSEKLCNTLLSKKYSFVVCTLYPESALRDVLEHVQGLNETRIQRDVMPRIVPPAEILRFHGQPILSSICEDLNALWCYCQPKGGSIPKPDYTVGLSQDVFSKEEIQRLKNYKTPQRPYMVTPDVCFPFLTCEAKSGDGAMSRAQSQNMGSGSVAVGAILELYKEAYGKTEPARITELYGEILTFSVSHNDKLVSLWGHYAVLDDTDNEEKFYYHELDTFSITVGGGRHKNKAYNFVRSVYEKFAPQHIKRVTEAAAALPALAERTGRTSSASDVAPSGTESQEGTFKKPGEPASVTKARVEWDKQMKEKEEKMEEQMEQERKESREREERMNMQMKEREERMNMQIGELMALLRQARS